MLAYIHNCGHDSSSSSLSAPPIHLPNGVPGPERVAGGGGARGGSPMHPRCQHRWCRGRVARPTRALALTAALGALCDRPCRPYSTNASSDPPKTRTWDSRLRGPTSYPLSQRASIVRSAQTPRPRASAFAEPIKTAAKALPKTRRGLNYRCEGEIPCFRTF